MEITVVFMQELLVRAQMRARQRCPGNAESILVGLAAQGSIDCFHTIFNETMSAFSELRLLL